MHRLFLIILASAALNYDAHAGAPEPPDTIYIDGKPCGSFCQLFFDLPQAAEPAEEVDPAVREPAVAPSRNRGPTRKPHQRLRKRIVERVPLPKARPMIAFPRANPADSQSVSDDAKATGTMKTVMQLSEAAEVAARFTAEASASMSRGSISGNDDTDAGFKTIHPAWFRHRAPFHQDDFYRRGPERIRLLFSLCSNSE
jgi:hypothetical protein